ncbi:MAG TPA: hypothetical protein VJ966_00685 [Actinomycetes bacterium]|nr:hypothetical protein [Actinomycetes bacterium]
MYDPLDPHAPAVDPGPEDLTRDQVTIGELAQADGATDPVDTDPLADPDVLGDEVDTGGWL